MANVGKKTKSSSSSKSPVDAIKSLDATFESESAKKLAERPPNSFTRAEYMQTTGTSSTTASKRIGLLLKTGKIIPVRFPVKKADQVIQMMQGYQIVDVPNSAPRK